MSWDASVLFDAFAAEGLLASATVTYADTSTAAFRCGLEQPDDLMLSGRAQSRQYLMEYETAAIPALSIGLTVVIAGATYTVREPPKQERDGFYTKVLLTKS